MQLDINDFCLKEIGGFVAKLEKYDEVIARHSGCKLYQYEEVIYLKKKWVLNMMTYLGWKMKPGQPMNIANRFNIIPKKEDTSKHIRQVHPGNYLNKLDPDVIHEINKKYTDVLVRFNYL